MLLLLLWLLLFVVVVLVLMAVASLVLICCCSRYMVLAVMGCYWLLVAISPLSCCLAVIVLNVVIVPHFCAYDCAESEDEF